jgi:hypothetical protein
MSRRRSRSLSLYRRVLPSLRARVYNPFASYSRRLDGKLPTSSVATEIPYTPRSGSGSGPATIGISSADSVDLSVSDSIIYGRQ